MNLIFFSRRQGQARHLHLTHPLTLALAGVMGMALLAGVFALGMRLGASGSGAGAQLAEVNAMRQQVQDRVDAMALRLGQINAHVIRLEALGKRLTTMAGISNRELDFDTPPAVGGPEEGKGGVAAQVPDLNLMLDALQRKLQLRDAQLFALENVVMSRSLEDAVSPSGRPVLEGYVSSHFGGRQDPFDGTDSIHRGVDFAGPLGSQVMAVAAGVVTRAESVSGYGNLVEINHGGGFVTRYAHNQRALVRVGETVSRGTPIALMGSTGRSTGPHVHVEVLLNGQHQNPLKYIDP
jgi:murein DD-endopeptidase MepM/ murein hydrolase activator NlpD